jgi:hypothetical protein
MPPILMASGGAIERSVRNKRGQSVGFLTLFASRLFLADFVSD